MNNLNVEIATIQRRFAAYLIDTAILLFPGCILLILFAKFPIILNIMHISLNCLYYTYFISSTSQATLGQQLMNIYVVSLDKTKIEVTLALDRSLSQFFLPIVIMIIAKLSSITENLGVLFLLLLLGTIALTSYAIWYLRVIFSDQRQTIHDVLFKTVVVAGKRL